MGYYNDAANAVGNASSQAFAAGIAIKHLKNQKTSNKIAAGNLALSQIGQQANWSTKVHDFETKADAELGNMGMSYDQGKWSLAMNNSQTNVSGKSWQDEQYGAEFKILAANNKLVSKSTGFNVGKPTDQISLEEKYGGLKK